MSAWALPFRHFLRQLASFEATSTGGEAKHAIVAVVSLVAGPGYLAALAAARGSRAREYTHSGIVPPELWLWKQEWLLLCVSLVAVAALVAIQWRSATVAAAVPCRLLGFRDAGAGEEGQRYGGGLASGALAAAVGGARGRPVARAVSSFVSGALLRSPERGVHRARPLRRGRGPHRVRPRGSRAPGARVRCPRPPRPAASRTRLRAAVLRARRPPALSRLPVVAGRELDLPPHRIPFTCTYQPGKANLRVTWPRHAAVFVLYCGVVPSLAARVEAQPVSYAASLALLLVAWRWLVRLRERQARDGRLVFDDSAAAPVLVLGLEWRRAADQKAGTNPA